MTSSATATVVVEITPPGRGAVAVVVVAGPDATRAVDNCFVARSGRSVGDTPLGRIVYGRWGGPEGEEIVLCRRDEEQIEVHCHGGTAAVEAVLNRLAKEGCERLTWREWINLCAPDPLQAAAQIALADATTERTAAILLDQLNGALSATIREVISSVAAAEWSTAAKTIDELLSRQELGLHLITPWRIVVFGAPNVGKSSLIDALAGYDRAIVSPTPGTTRDVVTVETAIDGWPVQLSDTAGFRETEDELESAGIELATTALSKADLAIFVHDATKLHDQIDYDSPQLAFHKRAIHVINKIDLISTAERSQLIPQFFNLRPDIDPPQVVSALNGEGIANLISAIARVLLTDSLPAESPVPFTREQVDALTSTKSAIDNHDAAAASTLLHALLTPSSF